MSEIIWKELALKFLRKIDKKEASRIVKKVDEEIKKNPRHYLKQLVNADFDKIRIGNFRLFVDYKQKEDELIIYTIKFRKNAYKI